MNRMCRFLPLFAVIAGLGSLAEHKVVAAEIVQSRTAPDTTDWNDPSNWGGHAVEAGNVYVTAPTEVLQNLFSLNGEEWKSAGRMRTNRLGSSTFEGDALHLSAGTMLLCKVENSGVSTANIVLDGGLIIHAGSGSSNGESGTLAGTIAFGKTRRATIAVHAAGRFTFTVASSIRGGPEDVLQLVMYGSKSINHLDLTGDLGGFSGTLVVAVADEGVGAGSSFSIQSSAPRAKIVLETSSPNFLYNLVTDVNFGALVVGGKTLAPGRYGYAELDALAPGAFNDFGGSIVVGEPR